MMFEAKLKEMGIEIPEAAKPLAAYIPAVQTGEFVYTSGQIPMVAGELKYKGKLGSDLTEEEGYASAKVCAINCLSAVKGLIGSLDKIERLVKVTGFVNSAPGFNTQHKVVNGASEFFGEVFGDAGKHARSAVGVSDLPNDAATEIEIIVKLK
ncbi:MAG: RidA family protein [Peptococcaceae bacterium]|jgi:enamine deaminase RidA (YjgF/YER057c/UK114 family)|nr:RidA family protein [Peptococcaceae bacterium]